MDVLEDKNKIKILSFEQEYFYLQYNQAIVHKWNALKSGEIYDGEKIVKDFEPRLKKSKGLNGFRFHVLSDRIRAKDILHRNFRR